MLSTRISVLLICALLLSGGQGAFCQGGQQNWVTFGSSGGFQTSLAIFDKDGQPFINPDEDVSGSAFFLPGWASGTVRLQDSTGYTGIKLKLDLMRQEVHFQGGNKVEMVLPKGLIREIVLWDSASVKGPQAYLFRCGFPPVDNLDARSFYRVVVSGRLMLLESVRKVLVAEKNEISGEEKKDIREYDDYYLFAGGALRRVKKERAFILAFMADQQARAGAFADSSKVNWKSIDDIGRLVAWYDGLSP